MRHATITKQRIHKNRRLIIAATRHVASGSRYALTRSPHPIHKLTKKRPRAPLRPGTAYAIAHARCHRLKTLSHATRHRTLLNHPHKAASGTHTHTRN